MNLFLIIAIIITNIIAVTIVYQILKKQAKKEILIFMAIGLFPTNHPKSSEVFDLLDKFATVAAVMSEGGDTGGKDNDRKRMDCSGIQRR